MKYKHTSSSTQSVINKDQIVLKSKTVYFFCTLQHKNPASGHIWCPYRRFKSTCCYCKNNLQVSADWCIPERTVNVQNSSHTYIPCLTFVKTTTRGKYECSSPFYQSRAKAIKGKAMSSVPLLTYVAANDMLYWFFNVASTVLYREQQQSSGDIVKIRFDEKLWKIYILCNNMCSVYLLYRHLLGKQSTFQLSH